MKKILSLFAAGVLLFAACCKDTAETPTKSITFSCSGDWTQNAKAEPTGIFDFFPPPT